MGRKMGNKTVKNIEIILHTLRNYGNLHLRGISRISNIGIGTVAWIVDKYLYPDFVEINVIDEFGIRAKIISLKRNATVEDVIKMKQLRKRVRGI